MARVEQAPVHGCGPVVDDDDASLASFPMPMMYSPPVQYLWRLAEAARRTCLVDREVRMPIQCSLRVKGSQRKQIKVLTDNLWLQGLLWHEDVSGVVASAHVEVSRERCKTT